MFTSFQAKNEQKMPDTAPLLNAHVFSKIAAGDQDAFYLLYQQTSTSIYSFLLSILQNKEDAEDLLQETLIKVRLHAHLYKDQGKPLAWILTIARNLALMKLRSQKRTSFQAIEDFDLVANFEGIQTAENRMVLKAAFSILEEEERSIIILHAVSGMKHREIATILNKPLATVLSKYRRAIKKLQKELTKNETVSP